MACRNLGLQGKLTKRASVYGLKLSLLVGVLVSREGIGLFPDTMTCQGMFQDMLGFFNLLFQIRNVLTLIVQQLTLLQTVK